MSEEKKAQEQPAPKPNEVSGEVLSEAKGSGPVQAPETAPQGQAKKKNPKINRMSLKEVEERLNAVKEKMGSFDSRYAKELLNRKEVLLKGNK